MVCTTTEAYDANFSPNLDEIIIIAVNESLLLFTAYLRISFSGVLVAVSQYSVYINLANKPLPFLQCVHIFGQSAKCSHVPFPASVSCDWWMLRDVNSKRLLVWCGRGFVCQANVDVVYLTYKSC